MYVLYSIGVILIMLTIVDAIYFGHKKYIEYVNKKSGQNRETQSSLLYPGAFLVGGLLRIFLMAKDVTFLILLKESCLFGLLVLLVIFNIWAVKNKFNHGKYSIEKFKNIERRDGEKLFTDKDNKK